MRQTLHTTWSDTKATAGIVLRFLRLVFLPRGRKYVDAWLGRLIAGAACALYLVDGEWSNAVWPAVVLLWAVVVEGSRRNCETQHGHAPLESILSGIYESASQAVNKAVEAERVRVAKDQEVQASPATTPSDGDVVG